MFAYFGYGSNINLTSLRAKGVEPISSQRAILHGWRLKFNVQHWFRHEGGVGNIEPSDNPDDDVEGMLHLCSAEHLASLDAVESYGVGYDRITVMVETEDGPIDAFTYVGLPAFIDDRCLPSKRYLNIIIKGGEAAGLSQSYIDRLRHHPLHVAEKYMPFEYPDDIRTTYTAESLAMHPHLTALAGAVFDMRGARKLLVESLAGLVGGKDMTLFYVKRHDSSNGSETAEDIKEGRISEGAKEYLNAYLHEYNKEFNYVGRFLG